MKMRNSLRARLSAKLALPETSPKLFCLSDQKLPAPKPRTRARQCQKSRPALKESSPETARRSFRLDHVLDLRSECIRREWLVMSRNHIFRTAKDEMATVASSLCRATLV